MKTLWTRTATQWITGLFIISTVSGVALFFHWAPSVFHAMHEWLSMLLLLPFILHLWKNWAAFMGYIKRKTLWIPLVLSVAIAVPFAWPSSQAGGARGGNPAFRIVGALSQSSLAQLAPAFRTTPEALLAKLRAEGFKVESPDASVSQIAGDAGKDALAVLVVLARSR